jgi:hypothetical protein
LTEVKKGRPRVRAIKGKEAKAVCQAYLEGEFGLRFLAQLYRTTYSEVRRVLKEAGVPMRRRGRPIGS